MESKPEVGRKNDSMKDRWDLLPWGPISAVVKVLTFGAIKYGPGNWMKLSDPFNRYFSAAIRHLVAYKEGEWLDLCPEHGKGWAKPRPEDRPPDCKHCSGLPHLAHAVCNLLFLFWFGERREKGEYHEENPEGNKQ